MTPLQQAAQALLDAINPQGWHKAEMLRKALADEQAQWGPAKTLEASGKYDEATDENWWPEGWCEAKAHEEAYWLDDKP